MNEDWVGKTLSKVIIERKLSRGGMAEVYLGRHTTLDRPVAIKILHGYLADDESLRERTQQEARAIASLRHPNIVQVFDFDVAAGRPYIVMELLDGISLADYLNAQHQAGFSLPLPRITNILHQLGSALDYAHQHGIIHRDIKPSNVMLRKGQAPLGLDLPLPEDAQAVLTDFGIARLTHATSLTASGSVLGTPFYMSPEQINGGEIDQRSDIYALGIVAYEMLAGARPFGSDEDTPAAILFKQVNETPPPIPNTDSAIQQAVFHAIAKDKVDRYPTAGEFAEALEAAFRSPTSGGAAVTSATGVGGPTRKFNLSRFGRPALLALGAIALVAAAYFGISSLVPTAPPGAPGVDETALPTATSLAAGSEGIIPTPAAIPVFTLTGGVMLIEDSVRFLNVRADPLPAGPALVQLRTNQGETIELGELILQPTPVTGVFEHPEGAAILGEIKEVLIALPAGDGGVELGEEFVIPVPPSVSSRFILLGDVVGVGSQTDEIMQGLLAQASHYASHLGFALDAIAAGNLPGTRAHSEHVINILSGRSGEFYGDWNGNDLVENPGDDVGLLVYLELLNDLLQAPLASENEQTRLAAEALDVQLQAYLSQANQALSLARQIVLADTIEVIHELGIDQEISRLDFDEQLPALVDDAGQIELGYFILLK